VAPPPSASLADPRLTRARSEVTLSRKRIGGISERGTRATGRFLRWLSDRAGPCAGTAKSWAFEYGHNGLPLTCAGRYRPDGAPERRRQVERLVSPLQDTGGLLPRRVIYRLGGRLHRPWPLPKPPIEHDECTVRLLSQ